MAAGRVLVGAAALLLAAGAAVVAAAGTRAPVQSGTGLEPVDPEQPGRWRGSQLIGSAVRDAAGQGIGRIEDIIVDPDGRISMVVLSFGGFLGMGEKLFAVPWSAMRIERGRGDELVVMLDTVRKETLQKAPSFSRDRWPDPGDRRWADESRRYWSDASITAAVKTRLARERAGELAGVTVDTERGVVRLTGRVPSDRAKARAAELARAVEGVREVRNDLRVQENG